MTPEELVGFTTDPKDNQRVISIVALSLANQFGSLLHDPKATLLVVRSSHWATHPDFRQQ